MTVCYLEVDDEITTAIARLRGVTDGEAVIVVPSGSRIATSRINFKLLAREANERRLNVVAVSGEPAARALAVSAGLPAYDSLQAAEQALATFREQDRKLAERLGGEPGVVPDGDRPRRQMPEQTPEETQVQLTAPWSTAQVGEIPRPAVEQRAADLQLEREREPAVQTRSSRRVGIAPLLVAGLLVLLLAGVAYGAYLFLPTATITLEPIVTELRPAPFTVVADPNVAVSDVAAAVIPAELLEIPISVTSTFPATGLQAHETRATGVVRFRSENTVNAVAVAQGTVVTTGGGVEFETTEAGSVPRADFATSTPGTVDIPVRAVRPGVTGNVAADAISELPAALRSQLVSVRNPDAIDGGRRVEEPVVSQADFDAALIALDDQLEQALGAKLQDPSTTPRGLTLYPRTAQTGHPEPAPTADEVVGLAQPTFSLGLESVATVIAVNEALVDELGDARLGTLLAPGQKIVGDDVSTTHSVGLGVVDTISYVVAPVAAVYSEPDRQQLLGQVRGKSVTDARRILGTYGMVDVSMWPEFVDRIPDQAARISLTILAPSTDGPSQSPRP